MNDCKKKWLILINKLLSGIMVILGFSSCDKFEPSLEYGSPYVTYEVKGKVTSQDNVALENIVVKVKPINQDGKLDVISVGAVTNVSGEYKNVGTYNSDIRKLRVYCIDNTGTYGTDSIDVTMNPQKTENTDDSWNNGSDSKNVDFKLKKN